MPEANNQAWSDLITFFYYSRPSLATTWPWELYYAYVVFLYFGQLKNISLPSIVLEYVCSGSRGVSFFRWKPSWARHRNGDWASIKERSEFTMIPNFLTSFCTLRQNSQANKINNEDSRKFTQAFPSHLGFIFHSISLTVSLFSSFMIISVLSFFQRTTNSYSLLLHTQLVIALFAIVATVAFAQYGYNHAYNYAGGKFVNFLHLSFLFWWFNHLCAKTLCDQLFFLHLF